MKANYVYFVTRIRVSDQQIVLALQYNIFTLRTSAEQCAVKRT